MTFHTAMDGSTMALLGLDLPKNSELPTLFPAFQGSTVLYRVRGAVLPLSNPHLGSSRKPCLDYLLALILQPLNSECPIPSMPGTGVGPIYL